MTRIPKNKRKPTNTNGKDASPRGGDKSKQTRVAKASGTSSPGPQQTKLTFAPTASAASAAIASPTPKLISNEMIAITPDAAKLPPLPENPIAEQDQDSEISTETKKNTKTQKN
jgi:hypothetical protein